MSQGGAILAATIHWNAVECGENSFTPGVSEHLFHCKPVEAAWKKSTDNGRIKMADVIGCHDERAAAGNWCKPYNSNFTDEGENQSAGRDNQPMKGCSEELYERVCFPFGSFGFHQCRMILGLCFIKKVAALLRADWATQFLQNKEHILPDLAFLCECLIA